MTSSQTGSRLRARCASSWLPEEGDLKACPQLEGCTPRVPTREARARPARHCALPAGGVRVPPKPPWQPATGPENLMMKDQPVP